MAKVKISRDVDGTATQMEVEESEILDSDTLATDTHSSNEDKPKMFNQDEVNQLLAKERRSAATKYGTLQSSYDALQKQVQDNEAATEAAAKAQVEILRKNVPENIGTLLDKLTFQEQLTWLQDPKNKTDKKQIPPLPKGRENNEEPNLGMAKIKF